MRTLCRYGFDAMRLHSIALWVLADNDAAVRVYEKVGFRHDGRHRDAFRGQGRWHDMILMSLACWRASFGDQSLGAQV